jgi:hypothetical protein
MKTEVNIQPKRYSVALDLSEQEYEGLLTVLHGCFERHNVSVAHERVAMDIHDAIVRTVSQKEGI